MSGAADALGDPGVLAPLPTIAFGASDAVALVGGLAVLPWRGDALRAQAAGIACAADDRAVAPGSFAQAVVHLGKGRDAFLADLAGAWRALARGGRLLLCGDNALGAAAAFRRVGELLAQEPTVLAQRNRGRIAVLRRGAAGEPDALAAPPAREVPLAPPELAAAFAGPCALRARPGVFSADGLDDGTRALLAALAERTEPPQRVLDLGCGAGHLAIAALRRWPSAHAALADADARAVASARDNVAALGLTQRASVHWWDAHEPPPLDQIDLVLCNPPFHAGAAVDYAPARAMFRAAAAASAPKARWLIVANRRLPYEHALAAHGEVATRAQEGGFKVLEVTRG